MDFAELKRNLYSYVMQPSNGIVAFSMSADSRTLVREPALSGYPQLQMDTPTWRPSIERGGRHTKVYDTVVAVLSPASPDDWASQDDVLTALEGEMDVLIAYLDFLRKETNGTLTGLSEAFPIKNWQGDNLFGWGIGITLEVPREYCYEPSGDVKVVFASPPSGKETLLHGLNINTESYTVQWGAEDPPERILGKFEAQINADTDTHGVTAHVFLNDLILVGSTPSTPVLIGDSEGHGWQFYS